MDKIVRFYILGWVTTSWTYSNMTFEVKIYVKKGCIERVSNLEKVVLPESVGGFPANLHLPPACVPQPTEIIYIH